MNKVTPKIIRNSYRFVSVILFLLWSLILSACEVQSEANLTDMTPTIGGESVQTAVNSIPTEITRTRTSTSAILVTTDVTTNTSTATMIAVPTVTLNAEETPPKWQMLDNEVAAIIASNNGCQLPCWWGIEPGDLIVEARQIFDSIDTNGWIDSPEELGGLRQIGFFRHVYRNEDGNDIYVSFSINLFTQDGSIEVISINVARNVAFNPNTSEYTQIGERLLRDWGQYSPKSMFELLGEPDLIYLLPRNFADGDSFYYELNLYYLAHGIVVSYSFPLLVNDNGERTMCLDMFDINSMDFLLYDPTVELPNSYLEVVYTLWPLSSRLNPEDSRLIEGGDIESQTGLSIDEFLVFVLDNESGNNCFSIN